MNILLAYNFALLFFSFCSFFIGILIWLKRQDAIGRIYFVFSFIAGIWGACLARYLTLPVSYEEALTWARIANALATFIGITWAHFCVVYTGNEEKCRRSIRVLYLGAAGIALFTFSPWFIPRMEPVMGFPYFPRAGIVYYFHTALFVFSVVFGFTNLWFKMSHVTGQAKFQIKGLFIATLLGFLGGGLTYFPVFGFPFPIYGYFLMPIYPFIMAYFIIREKLFDEFELVQAAHRDKLATIGMLAASMNHEIKNPLYVLRSGAEAVLDKLDQSQEVSKEKARSMMENVVKQTSRIMEMMKTFSSFAKRGVDEESRVEKVAVSEVLDTVLKLVRYELEMDKISLKLEIAPDLPKIRADRGHLEEIFFNLIVNACQAIGKRGGEIKIQGASEKGKVTITISDNGPGIPKERLNQVFQPFYTTKDQGTGLGLYVVKMLVERNGGSVEIGAVKGAKTEFVLRFSQKKA